MSLSPTATQQRDRQVSFSRPLLAWSAAGSLALHGGLLPVILLLARQDPPAQPAAIELVFTEPVEPVVEELPEPEPAIFDEATQDNTPVPLQPQPESFASAPTSASVQEVPDTTVDEVAEPDVSEPSSNPLDNLLASIRQRRPSSTQGTPSASTDGTASTGTADSSAPSSNPSGTGSEVATGPSSSGPPSPSPGPRTVACRSCPKPSYPRSALDAGVEGTISIMVDINSNGNVTSATLVGSSGNSALDQAALSTVRRRWRFQPIRGGASGVVVSVVMSIQGSDLNQRATERGDRESVEIPSPDVATEEDNTEESAESPDPSGESPSEDASNAPSTGPVAPDDAPEATAEPISPETVSQPEPTPAPEPASEAPEPQPESSESGDE